MSCLREKNPELPIAVVAPPGVPNFRCLAAIEAKYWMWSIFDVNFGTAKYLPNRLECVDDVAESTGVEAELRERSEKGEPRGRSTFAVDTLVDEEALPS